MAGQRDHTDIESILSERRKFPPPPSSSSSASIKSLDEYDALCRRAEQDPEGFWGECARELAWFKPYGKVLEWKFPFAKWFVGGKINAVLQLPRSSSDRRTPQQGRVHLGRRAGRLAHPDLPDARR